MALMPTWPRCYRKDSLAAAPGKAFSGVRKRAEDDVPLDSVSPFNLLFVYQVYPVKTIGRESLSRATSQLCIVLVA